MFTCIETAELCIAFQQFVELRRLFIAVAGQKHPQVLHGRTHAGVVQVNDMQLIIVN